MPKVIHSHIVLDTNPTGCMDSDASAKAVMYGVGLDKGVLVGDISGHVEVDRV